MSWEGDSTTASKQQTAFADTSSNTGFASAAHRSWDKSSLLSGASETGWRVPWGGSANGRPSPGARSDTINPARGLVATRGYEYGHRQSCVRSVSGGMPILATVRLFAAPRTVFKRPRGAASSGLVG